MKLVKFKTLLALGLPNLTRFFLYQFGVKTGMNKVKRISSKIVHGNFFKPYDGPLVTYESNMQWVNNHTYFGLKRNVSSTPIWNQSCLNSKLADCTKPWYLIEDFDSNLGDVKGVWEASRFDWVISFAQQAKCGDESMLVELNVWLSDWIDNNPCYVGVNWKCGQEASIRVMHLALGAFLLGQTLNTTFALLSLIKAHLKRISPTIMYAVAQDNNHGTTEAAALYIGGSWLALNGDIEGYKWVKQGRKWLEDRAQHLIEADGSFSQYSVNYHRVVLDTYCLVEVWRVRHSLENFSEATYKKLRLATAWLHYFTDITNGDAPNLGANDGARLIPLTSTDHRDFRPSVQLACALFYNSRAYNGDGLFNIPLKWLGVALPADQVDQKQSKDFDCGGYAYLLNNKAAVYLRYPNFNFRPSQCDALHVDFWLNGVNVFRDGGTFSYNAGQKYIDYYGGVKSHNTVEFDVHDQMPRLSRFLLGDWLKTSFKIPLSIKLNSQIFAAGYKDRFGCIHKRFIELSKDSLNIKDELSGFKSKAILRFRLIPSNWLLSSNTLKSDICSITFTSNMPINRLELTSGFESRYYHNESQIPVLEIEVSNPGTILSEVAF